MKIEIGTLKTIDLLPTRFTWDHEPRIYILSRRNFAMNPNSSFTNPHKGNLIFNVMLCNSLGFFGYFPFSIREK